MISSMHISQNFENCCNFCLWKRWVCCRNEFRLNLAHFTVVCLLTWPFVWKRDWSWLWYKPHCFSYGNHVVLMPNSFYLHIKNVDSSLVSTQRLDSRKNIPPENVNNLNNYNWTRARRIDLYQNFFGNWNGISPLRSPRSSSGRHDIF